MDDFVRSVLVMKRNIPENISSFELSAASYG